ncbi:uncharacterized protein LOC132296346 [Cornus florida]|uniref:uncharacterized protein LOC132296346 n=1 Tax=Cornus florida TaxID=4283 RepID=UPI0028976738|nr:uncharacterized protein LOC132296346 [Cornus florida]
MATSVGGAMLLKAVDASGNIKDVEYVVNLFIPVIKDVGEHNVVQIITDNGSNFKAAGGIIESTYPHIFWTPCVVHCLNLTLKSICEPSETSPQYTHCKWIIDLVSSVQNIRNFIVNHGMVLSIFNNYSELGLLRVAETRFASSIIMAKRLKEVKDALEKMVMDPTWRRLLKGDGKSTIKIKAREVKKCIVSDSWWDDLEYLLEFTEPIVDFLRLANTDAPVLHLIYDMWDTMIEKVKFRIFVHDKQDMLTGQSNFFDVIHNILETRWNKSNNPLHCMAHSLVPKYYTEAWIRGGSDGVPRLSPHEDQEVSSNRSKCFKQLFSNQDDLRKVYIEYGAFSSGSGYFNESHVIDAKLYEEPISWWANHGSSTPMLQALAFKLLSQPASSSCCERNWSTYSLIQSIKRNRLTTSRAEDLVFVYCNLRLMSRKKNEYKEGPTKYWDLCGDKFDIDGNTLGELAELSINEPELELITFDDAFEEGQEAALGAEVEPLEEF